MAVTTIQLEKSLVTALKKEREYPRQTYNELLEKMIRTFQKAKHSNQYDQFLHQIQQQKMTELWDNEALEDAEESAHFTVPVST